MAQYKESFYNIDLQQEGYIQNQSQNSRKVYNIMRGLFADIPQNPTEEQVKELVTNGILVPQNVDEAQQYIDAHEKAIHDDFPKRVSITIATTLHCNYRCVYCFEDCQKNNADMTEEVLQDIIDYLKKEIDRNKNLQSLSIRFFGGEPLLRLDVIRDISNEIIPYCKEHDVKYSASITTNGYLMTKEVSEELYDLKITTAQVAIDGFEETYNKLKKPPKDAFRKVLQNIEDSKIKVVIRLNTTRETQNEVLDFIREIAQLPSVKEKRNIFTVSRIKEYEDKDNLNYGFTDREWLDYREHLTDLFDIIQPKDIVHLSKTRLLPCPHNQKRNVVLGADGYIYRCDFHLGNKKQSIGKITEGIPKTEGNKIEQDFVSSTITNECRKCKYLPICAGGLCRYAELKRGKSCEAIIGGFQQNLRYYLQYVER